MSDAISIKTLRHYADNFLKGGEFLYYDYGEEENKQLYGSKEPPSYDLKKIRLPIYLIYGQNDLLGTEENVMHLFEELPSSEKKHGVWSPDNKRFNHNDFVGAKDVKSFVYDHLIKFINTS